MRLDEVEERRARSLLARKAASQEDYDKAEAQRKKSAAQVEADQASLEQSVADYDIDIANAKADVAKAEAAVEDARINLGYCRMYAPIDGRIGELKVKVGNLVGDAGQTELVTIQQLDPMGLDLHPAARYLPVATRAAAPKGLAGQADRRGGTPASPRRQDDLHRQPRGHHHVDLPDACRGANPDGSLLPGQYIRATMTIGEYVDAVVVPEQAVVEGQEGSRVFVVDAENKVQVAKVSPVDVVPGPARARVGARAGPEGDRRGHPARPARPGRRADRGPARAVHPDRDAGP